MFGLKKIQELGNVIAIKNSLIKAQEVILARYEKKEAERKSFEYMLNEDIPIEQNERKSYMSDITMFYRKIFKKKIDHAVSLQKDALTIIGKTPEEYALFRATANAFFLLNEWFLEREREHLGNLQEKRQAVESGMDIASEISSKYK